jgi:hypothetical protein
MANTLTNTTFTMLGQRVLNAFVGKLAGFKGLNRNYSAEAAGRGDKIKVLFVGQQAGARDWAGSYVMDDSNAEGLDISINQRKYVSWQLGTDELANNPQISLDTFADNKGFQLAKAVYQDVFGLITNANFGAPIFTGPAENLDSHDVSDMETTLDDAEWPDDNRSLILKPTYHGAIVKDARVEGDLGVQGNMVLTDSRVPRLHNFDLYKSAYVPANGENLKFVAIHPDAILIAGRVLEPEDVAKKSIIFETFTHEETGITIVYREWYDPNEDKVKRVFEHTYGRRVGNTAAAKRGVSA